MSKFKYFTYIIGTILLFSSFDVQKCADALQKAYEEKNHDAFVDAFPDKYGDFVNVYGYDFDNWQKKILYDDANEHISFLFSTDRVLESKVLDKLLSLSYNYVWSSTDAVEYVIDGTLQLLLNHPNRMTAYFSKKTDEEVILFLQMALIGFFPDYILKQGNELVEIYKPYSKRMVQLLKIACVRAQKATETMVIY